MKTAEILLTKTLNNNQSSNPHNSKSNTIVPLLSGHCYRKGGLIKGGQLYL